MLLAERPFAQLFIAGALVMIGSLSVAGQVRFLSQRDYDGVVARFQTSTDGIPHREITKTDELVEKKLVRTSETVREWDSSNNYRIIRKTSDGSITESIWLGSIEYSRTGNGNWTKTDWSKGGTGGGGGPANTGFYTVEEKSEGQAKLLMFTEQRTFGDGAAKRIETTKTFVNSLFWRQRVEHIEALGSPENVILNSVTTFEYDRGNTEITAPIK